MNRLKLFFMASLLMVNLGIFADHPEPFNSVRDRAHVPYYVQDGYIIYDLINTHNSAVIVDVESQDGCIARYIAQQADSLPSLAKIYSISNWTSCDPTKKHLFQLFLSNVKHENTSNLITPIRMTSQEGAKALNITADFISLVGADDQDRIYRDILAWYPHLSDTGIICGNNWYENSVEVGVTKAAAALDLNLKINGSVWYFEKAAP